MILTIGKHYEPLGKLAAIHSMGGERYYFFVDDNITSMIDAHTAHEAISRKLYTGAFKRVIPADSSHAVREAE